MDFITIVSYIIILIVVLFFILHISSLNPVKLAQPGLTDNYIFIKENAVGINTFTNGVYSLYIDETGNLLFKNNDSGEIIWSSDTSNKGLAPFKLVMQNDGNLVLSDHDKKILWTSNTYLTGIVIGKNTNVSGVNNGPYTLEIVNNSDGSFIITNKNNVQTPVAGGQKTMDFLNMLVRMPRL